MFQFCSQFPSRPERSTGWAHMQSVRAGAVQTHFLIFTLLLKSSSQQTSFWDHSRSEFRQKSQFLLKQELQTNVQKKVPPLTQTAAYDHGPGLPDSPPRVRGFLNKKQLSEQETREAVHF